MRTIKFRAISFKGVFYSKSLDKYYVSEPCRYDSGVTSLSLLFDIESERGIEDILSSTHFINTIGEQYWDRDWVKIGNIQFTGLLDKNGVEVFEGDVVTIKGDERKFYIRWFDDMCFAFADVRSDYVKTFYSCYDTSNGFPLDEWIEVIGNIYKHHYLPEENHD